MELVNDVAIDFDLDHHSRKTKERPAPFALMRNHNQVRRGTVDDLLKWIAEQEHSSAILIDSLTEIPIGR